MYQRTNIVGRVVRIPDFRILVVAVFIGLLALPAVSDTSEELIERFGNYHAIVIGINEYDALESYWPDLMYAEQDARDMAKILTDIYGFNVRTIYGSEATRKNILKAIRGKIESLGENDNLLIFYAGHGEANGVTDEGFWIPVDATDAVDEESWISFSKIRKLIKAKNADIKRVALITDSCYGGVLTEGAGAQRGRLSPNDDIESYRDWLKKHAAESGRLIIASGGIEKVPDQSEFSDELKSTLTENELDMVDLYHIFDQILYNSYFQDQEQTPRIETLMGPKRGLPAQFVLIRRQ